MRKSASISVTIAVKGSSSTIGRAILGFLGQTVRPREIIVVGDAPSLKHAKNTLLETDRIEVRWLSFSGDKNSTRNKGFKESRGEFILFTDDDMIPAPNLIEKSAEVLKNFDALIIHEQGSTSGNFLQQVHRLEKELVMSDKDAITPRLFKREFFDKDDLPFNSKFGVLDEWGFFLKLKGKKPKIGIVDSSFTVMEELKLAERFYKNIKKGLWVQNMIKENRTEGLRRINPLKRGLVIYIKNIKYIKQQPLIFSLLVLLKFFDLITFLVGYSLNLFNVTALKGTYDNKSK